MEWFNTIYDNLDLKWWWKISPLDKTLRKIETNKLDEMRWITKPLYNEVMNSIWVHEWDPVLVAWEKVWTVWFNETIGLHVDFDSEHSTITDTDITINWKNFTILQDHTISPVITVDQVDVVAHDESKQIDSIPTPRYIDTKLWDSKLSDLKIPNIYEGRVWTLNENELWINVWDPVFVSGEQVWVVWFNNTLWLHVDFDDNHTTISKEDYNNIRIWEWQGKPCTVLESGKISPVVTLPEVAVVDTAIESGSMFNLEDITVYLWKDLNTEILVDTINDLANNGTSEQKTKIEELKAVLWDKSKNSDWSSPMVESFQKNELSITNQWLDWKFWVQTFEKTKQWLWILPNGWINTWKIEDYNWPKEIYKVRGKNLIDKTTNTINTFSNQIWAQFDIKQNIMVQNKYGLKNFVLFNDWKIKIPDEFALIINWKNAEGKIYEPQKDDKWNVICDWECGLTWDWKSCIKISQNNVNLYDIPLEYIA